MGIFLVNSDISLLEKESHMWRKELCFPNINGKLCQDGWTVPTLALESTCVSSSMLSVFLFLCDNNRKLLLVKYHRYWSLERKYYMEVKPPAHDQGPKQPDLLAFCIQGLDSPVSAYCRPTRVSRRRPLGLWESLHCFTHVGIAA